MPREPSSIGEEIRHILGIPVDEANLYVAVLRAGKFSPAEGPMKTLAEAMKARGMLILESGGNSYLPVHPRMAMSNLFRSLEQRPSVERRQKRLAVDRLTLELISYAERETKDTNARIPRATRKRSE